MVLRKDTSIWTTGGIYNRDIAVVMAGYLAVKP